MLPNSEVDSIFDIGSNTTELSKNVNNASFDNGRVI